jgi:predicted dehydrogenase
MFSEKPMALSIAECDAILKVTTQNSVLLQLGFMRRFDPEFVVAQRASRAERDWPTDDDQNQHPWPRFASPGLWI